MKVLFCHDGPIRTDNKGNYYGIAHNDEMFKRYYSIGDELSVLIRLDKIRKIENTNNLSQITVSPFEVIEMPNISSIKGILFKRKVARKVIKKAVLESDYVVARLPSMSGFLAIDYARKYNKPYLTEVVACPWDAFWNHSYKGKLIAPYTYFATKKRVKNSNYVVYVTNKFLQKRYPTKGKSVNCSNVALTEFSEDTLERRKNKISRLNMQDKIIIGTTAAVDVRYKGQQYIIKALGKLKEEGITSFEYQLVGAGDPSYLMSQAKKYNVKEQVKFLGPLPHSQVFQWLETIDLYAQPSKQEGLPRALIEAMSRGLPALGAKTAGIPELLDADYVFSNKKNNIKEIIDILLSYKSKNNLKEQAKINFYEAKKYEKEIIETRRKEFFNEFKNSK
ncbi:glycosyltransferase family 4 protein [Halobacillus halophilus]|uniref:glycosyltransferase family 4 protein n=1 Tax=Halobacillus halophilus TaxID=1570 RepID=UPI001CD283CA|nr:glycosyltransferase [Halobacillus halophilus]MCA1010726.1 glycosyltransferase [Halobacillus halophilus]